MSRWWGNASQCKKVTNSDLFHFIEIVICQSKRKCKPDLGGRSHTTGTHIERCLKATVRSTCHMLHTGHVSRIVIPF